MLGLKVAAGNGGLCCLPGVQSAELRGFIAGWGREKVVGVIEELGVRRIFR